ncbi:MAG TPA: thioredoxin domain-containing protein [Chlamydiales bacterium]|nr:thioredoxin domain-containing protein [Chlamydiales bacterium]
MEKRQKRVIITVIVALLVLIGAGVYKTFQLPNQLTFSTIGHPTIGKGQFQVVLFEDFACVNCHHFTRNVLPRIAKDYIDTDKARLTVVPVAFEPGSNQLANAAIAVHRIAPSQFLAFIIALSEMQGIGKSGILRVAENVGGIDLERLAYAIDKKIFYGEIERNLAWATSQIPDFGTPMLFVNGYETSTDSFESLQRRIQQLEKMQ